MVAADPRWSDGKPELLMKEADIEEAATTLAAEPTNPEDGVLGADDWAVTTTKSNFDITALSSD